MPSNLHPKNNAVRHGSVARDPRTGTQVRIGVMGSAGGAVDPSIAGACRALGRAIAERGCCLLTGACQGLPHDAVLGAKEAHGHVVGISPAATLKEHVETLARRTGNTTSSSSPAWA